MPERRTKVLIVDDNPDIVSYVEMWLQMYGFTTLVARDGIEGIQFAEAQRPDVILLDLSMPRMDGLEVARRLSERPWRGEVLLVAHTAHNDELARSATRALGFDLHVAKPADLHAVVKTIREWSASRLENRAP